MYRSKALLFLIIPFFCGCKTANDSYYSYKVNGYIIDSMQHLLTSVSLISYGNYLFEFRNIKKINSTKHGANAPVIDSIKYDTIGVYLLSTKNKLYYEFDSFTLKNKIREVGKLGDKQSGTGFRDSDKISDSMPSYSPPVEIIMNNIKCFYSQVLGAGKSNIDTIKAKVLMVKIKNFNSLYKIDGTKFKDDDYTIIGLNVYNYVQKQGFKNEIETLKPLTEKEKSICESMVLKSKDCIIDTIKGLNIK